jgi:hypothetical protein
MVFIYFLKTSKECRNYNFLLWGGGGELFKYLTIIQGLKNLDGDVLAPPVASPHLTVPPLTHTLHQRHLNVLTLCIVCSLHTSDVDRHRVDADPDPEQDFHFDADPDPDQLVRP